MRRVGPSPKEALVFIIHLDRLCACVRYRPVRSVERASSEFDSNAAHRWLFGSIGNVFPNISMFEYEKCRINSVIVVLDVGLHLL